MHRHSNRHKYIHIYPDRGRHLVHIHTDVDIHRNTGKHKYINKYLETQINSHRRIHRHRSIHTDTDMQAYIHRRSMFTQALTDANAQTQT